MWQKKHSGRRILRALFMIAVVISSGLLITSTAYAAFFTINIGDSAVDPQWQAPFIQDSPTDHGGSGDIANAYFASNAITPTAFSFRLNGTNMTAGSSTAIQVGMDCNGNDDYGETVDRFVLPGIGEVFDGKGQSIGVFDIHMEHIGTTDIEWTASSSVANWGACTGGVINIQFYGPSGDITASVSYNLDTGNEITNVIPNYTSGAPGSFINLTGSAYPANQNGSVSINGVLVGNFLTDAKGEFVVTLDTSNLDEGAYNVTAIVNPQATTRFSLDNSSEIRAREGNHVLIIVPTGIAAAEDFYLPLVHK